MSVPSSGPDPANTILTVTELVGEALSLYTTAAAHGLDGIATITVTGVSNPIYNRTDVPTVISPDTFTFSLGYEGDATGGQWEYA